MTVILGDYDPTHTFQAFEQADGSLTVVEDWAAADRGPLTYPGMDASRYQAMVDFARRCGPVTELPQRIGEVPT